MKRLLVRLVLALPLACTSPLAFALAEYIAVVSFSVSAPFPIPSGTGIALFPGTGDGFEGVVGTGVANFVADAATPGSVFALANGSASAPPDSVAISRATAQSTGALTNTTTTNQVFPILIFGEWNLFASAGAFETASAEIDFLVSLDGVPLVQDLEPLLEFGGAAPAGSGTLGAPIGGQFNLTLTPGLHQLTIFAEARGQATATVPEPSTLLLAVAGVVMVACRRRQRCDS